MVLAHVKGVVGLAWQLASPDDVKVVTDVQVLNVQFSLESHVECALV